MKFFQNLKALPASSSNYDSQNKNIIDVEYPDFRNPFEIMAFQNAKWIPSKSKKVSK